MRALPSPPGTALSRLCLHGGPFVPLSFLPFAGHLCRTCQALPAIKSFTPSPPPPTEHPTKQAPFLPAQLADALRAPRLVLGVGLMAFVSLSATPLLQPLSECACASFPGLFCTPFLPFLGPTPQQWKVTLSSENPSPLPLLSDGSRGTSCLAISLHPFPSLPHPIPCVPRACEDAVLQTWYAGMLLVDWRLLLYFSLC
eukprot:RCo021641